MPAAKKAKPLFVGYDGCTTCKKAKAWLTKEGIAFDARPIVDQPPTTAELNAWIPTSKKPLKKWLNTSGQSYRAMGKDKVDAMSDAQLVKALAADGKLVKRPVLVADGGKTVLVGFAEDEWRDALLG